LTGLQFVRGFVISFQWQCDEDAQEDSGKMLIRPMVQEIGILILLLLVCIPHLERVDDE
jgi:hypothetical protein